MQILVANECPSKGGVIPAHHSGDMCEGESIDAIQSTALIANNGHHAHLTQALEGAR